MIDTERLGLSIVVPVMNEEESIPVLAAEIDLAMLSQAESWECIWVNDGSTDGTKQVLGELTGSKREHRQLELAGNFGQSAALAAGFEKARGRVIATLDGDGQNDPLDLPRLLEVLKETGVDMVNGVRVKRRDSIIRRISSRIANTFRNLVTGEHVTDVGCALRVFRSVCVDRLPVFKGIHRFLPTLVGMQGFKVTEVPVNHRVRERGKTKYGINNRLWVGIADTLAIAWMKRRLVWPEIKRSDLQEYLVFDEEASSVPFLPFDHCS